MQKICWLICTVLLFTQQLAAQQYNFKNFSFEDGLTESNISAICEDKGGNLWIGTLGGGLFKYDGYSFKNFQEANGLPSNKVHAVFTDQSGKLWAGTELGLVLYDGSGFSSASPLSILADKKITAIIENPQTKELWFGTGNHGLYRYRRSKITNYTIKNDLASTQINCLYFDQKGTLWVGTEKGVARFNSKNFTKYYRSDGLVSNSIKAIAQDKDGNLWFGSSDRGISKFDQIEFTTFNSSHGLPSNYVNAIIKDQKDNLWIGTSKGISKFHDNEFTTFNKEVGQVRNNVSIIYEDQTSNLWFGTTGRGLDKLDSEKFVHYIENDQMGRRVYAITQAINGNMIYATSRGGVTGFDGRNYSLLKGSQGFTSSQVQSLYYSPDSTLWIGTKDDGAFKFGRDGFTKLSVLEGLKSNNINGFAVGSLNNLWIATSDSGLSVIPLKTDSLTEILNFTTAHGLISNNINVITADLDGNIWIGTEDAGLLKLTLSIQLDSLLPAIKQYSVVEGLSSNSVKSILIDEKNRVYAGTSGGGINILAGKDIFKISKGDGLSSNNIYSLVFDNQNKLWAGTERGVERITFNKDLSVKVISYYGNEDGFKGIEVYKNASQRDTEGNIWFGTVNGVIKYNPKEDLAVNVIPKIQLTGIKLFFDNIEDTPFVDSTASNFPIPDQLVLPFDQNNLSFEFSGTYLRNPDAVRYKWMMEGVNDEWSPPLDRRDATFSNLSPGSYTFKVISGNEHGFWNEKPAVFNFQILPPPWKEWWVMPSAISLLILIISLIVYQRFKRIKTKNRVEKERLMMEKNIIELEQEAARLQMNPHFIFNSLNSIQGFIATNDPFQAKRYLAKFARLMRLILENAREEYIPLQNEVDILENYLALEKLSTNGKFDFTITLEDSIAPDNTEIPPMMIQPFVENAIIHGVKKKKGAGQIDLVFKIVGERIICQIKDDGIGRKASKETNNVKQKNHKSTGILVTKMRLAQFKKLTGINAGVKIIDLMENDEAMGTEVVITMPFEAY